MKSLKTLRNLMSNQLGTLPLAVLYLTDGCNSRCVTCDIWKNPRRNMSMELVERLIPELSKLGTSTILLSGGEAMQHPHWHDIASSFREQGMRVMLVTNGLLLPKQAEQLTHAIDDLIISLDGATPQSYQQIRGVNGFQLVMEGIRIARSANMPVTTRTTVQSVNFREIPAIIELGLKYDVNTISFLPMDFSSVFAFGARELSKDVISLQSNHGMLSHDETDELARILDDIEDQFHTAFKEGRIAESPQKLRRTLLHYYQTLNGERNMAPPRCNAPHFSVVIEVDGSLRPCYFLPSFGRLGSDQMSKTINNEAAIALRQAYRTGNRQECKRCVCPLYRSPRVMLRD